jgi:hypothetical protein
VTKSYHPRVHVPKPKFDSESAVRHTSQRCDTVRSVHLIAFVEMCIGKQRPDTFGIAFASMRHRGLGRNDIAPEPKSGSQRKQPAKKDPS